MKYSGYSNQFLYACGCLSNNVEFRHVLKLLQQGRKERNKSISLFQESHEVMQNHLLLLFYF